MVPRPFRYRAGAAWEMDFWWVSQQFVVICGFIQSHRPSGPLLSANWNAVPNNMWVVPVGGGIGRVFKLGFQPANGSLSFYYNVVRPQTIPSSTWQLRVQMALLFPRVRKR